MILEHEIDNRSLGFELLAHNQNKKLQVQRKEHSNFMSST